MHDLSVTLVAIATPPGRGGVGCVRISGPRAHAVANRLFRPSGSGGRESVGARRLRFGRFLGRDGRAVDHGYLVTFTAEAAYTREPTAELWTHGSPTVLGELVEAALASGAETAGPGEFTYRALRNGRLDLARAEAVRDLVAARTLVQARVAFAQAEGALSVRLAPVRDALAGLIARAEAAVEFVDESETHLAAGALEAGIAAARESVRALLSGFRAGRLVREGATVVITGLPNVGKSSLFNRLLEHERAIVTDLPGTTRDTLEESLDLEGIPVRLIDTAGLREAGDPVETEGVRRAQRARDEADLELLVLDGTRPPEPAEIEAAERLSESGGSRRGLVVRNKSDLPAAPGPRPPGEPLAVSAKTGQGLGTLRRRLSERLAGDAAALEDPVLTNARHAGALEAAAAALERAGEALRRGFTEEIALEELRDAMDRVGSITGELGAHELYERIFTTFCIGK